MSDDSRAASLCRARHREVDNGGQGGDQVIQIRGRRVTRGRPRSDRQECGTDPAELGDLRVPDGVHAPVDRDETTAIELVADRVGGQARGEQLVAPDDSVCTHDVDSITPRLSTSWAP